MKPPLVVILPEYGDRSFRFWNPQAALEELDRAEIRGSLVNLEDATLSQLWCSQNLVKVSAFEIKPQLP